MEGATRIGRPAGHPFSEHQSTPMAQWTRIHPAARPRLECLPGAAAWVGEPGRRTVAPRDRPAVSVGAAAGFAVASIRHRDAAARGAVTHRSGPRTGGRHRGLDSGKTVSSRHFLGSRNDGPGKALPC